MYARGCAANSGGSTKGTDTLEEVVALRNAVAGQLGTVRAQTTNREGSASSLYRPNMWLGDEETEAALTALEPKLEKTAAQLENLLRDIIILEVCVLTAFSACERLGRLRPLCSRLLYLSMSLDGLAVPKSAEIVMQATAARICCKASMSAVWGGQPSPVFA